MGDVRGRGAKPPTGRVDIDNCEERYIFFRPSRHAFVSFELTDRNITETRARIYCHIIISLHVKLFIGLG